MSVCTAATRVAEAAESFKPLAITSIWSFKQFIQQFSQIFYLFTFIFFNDFAVYPLFSANNFKRLCVAFIYPSIYQSILAIAHYFNCLFVTYILTTAELPPGVQLPLAGNHCSTGSQGNSCVFFPFSLFSGNHPGSHWSHHGQPYLLHMPCSHLQKDPEEWHHSSGDILAPFPIIFSVKKVYSLSLSLCFVAGTLGGSGHPAYQHLYHPVNFCKKQRKHGYTSSFSNPWQEQPAAPRPPWTAR